MKWINLLMENQVFKKKIHGCFLGTLLGDCLGAPFEGEMPTGGLKLVVQKYFDTLNSPGFEAPQKSYTDDTIMTKCIAQSLFDNNYLNPKDLAIKFVNEFYKDTGRGYGRAIPELCYKLRSRNFDDIFGPAKEQFGGYGSFGNGAAMRVAPLALFYHNDYPKMIEATKLSAQITHGNILGVNGAILQCIAIQQCLLLDPKETLDISQFCENLISKMSLIEKCNGSNLSEAGELFVSKLNTMQELLKSTSHAYDEKVIEMLGNDVTALHSVPTAIYCFLKSQSNIKNINTDNPFQRTLQCAISLGGDTDTIASMAGAIAGAYYGEDIIDKNIIRHCEDFDIMISFANRMCEVLENNLNHCSVK